MKAFTVVLASALQLALLPLGASGQVVNTDSLRRAIRGDIDQYRAQVAAAAAVFLDRTRSPSERLAAVRDVPALLDTQHIDGGVRVVFDPAEPIAVRVRGLGLVGGRILSDTGLTRRVAGIVRDATAAPELRAEAVTQLAVQSFTLPPSPSEQRLALQAAARDPDIGVRRVALRALAGHGDTLALGLLQRGLESPSTALLPPSEAVRLLGLQSPAPYYALLHQLMLQPPDSATRVATIQLLGGNAPSRGPIASYLRNPNEPPVVRHAALGALAAGDPRGLPSQVLAVVADEGAPLDLRLRAIKAVEVARTSRDPAVVGRAPDDFDRLMERLAATSPAPAVREAAQTYLSRTQSAH